MVAELNLLPCPMCGGPAKYEAEHDDRGNAVIECQECGANVGANILAEGVARWNRRTAPSSTASEELPPLPDARAIRAGHAFPKVYAHAYTADQMQAYARAAVSADRAQQGEPVAWTAEQIVDACVTAGLGILECNGLIVTLKGVATTAAAPADAPKRKYYYRVDGCSAPNSHSPECICWHDEGTGPLANEPDLIRSWRAPAEDAREQPPEAITMCECKAFGGLCKECRATRIDQLLRKLVATPEACRLINSTPEIIEEFRATGSDRAQAGPGATKENQ